MVYIQLDGKWNSVEATPNLIFVICPGAGTYSNRIAYQYLEKSYQVIYICKSDKYSQSKYDKYPPNWESNSFVENTGEHLGGISQIVSDYIKWNYIPEAIICGSRGGQVTLGKIWESFWRGPCLVINAGCLTSKTYIPKKVLVLFIIMENDYFTSVNTVEKVKILFDRYKSNTNQNGFVFYLPREYHMPNFNNKKVILKYGINLITNKQNNENITNINMLLTKI